MIEEDIQRIAEIVTEHAGPLGKFIVTKEFDRPLKKCSELTYQELKEIITSIVTKSIYNPEMREELKRKLIKEYANSSAE